MRRKLKIVISGYIQHPTQWQIEWGVFKIGYYHATTIHIYCLRF